MKEELQKVFYVLVKDLVEKRLTQKNINFEMKKW